MRRLIVAFSLLIALGLLVPPDALAQNAARVRVAHASPDAPAVDVFVDGESVLTNVAFFTLSDYLQLPAGQHRVQVAPTGQGAQSAVIDTTVDLTAGEEYTVAAVGRLASIQPLVLEDSSKQPEPGQALVRVVHAVEGLGAVDVKMADSTTPFLTDQAFKSADYVPVDAGVHTFEIAPAGTPNVFLITPELRFEAGWTYTLFVTGIPNSLPDVWVQARVDRMPEMVQ